MMQRAASGFALVVTVVVSASPIATAASFNCNVRGLARAETLICEDTKLSRIDNQLARRADAIARRMNYGQYLGLRHWQATSRLQRNECEADRECVAAHYRAQARLLDRLEPCLQSRFARRSCLRESLSVDREAGSSGGRRGAAMPPR